MADDDPIITIDRAGGMRYYQITTQTFTADRSRIGRAITFSDITEREQYRAELERQKDRLERFASMISHDLRNPLNVATARVGLLREESDNEHLAATDRALERMEELIDDLLTLARQGQPIEETRPVSLQAVLERCWPVIETKEATLAVGSDLRLLADGDRLQQLLENLLRNAIDHGGDDVFTSGYSTAESGTGFGLAIVEEVVDAHDWAISVTESAEGGARFEIRDVERTDAQG